MNGYELLASSYRLLLKRGEIAEDEAAKKLGFTFFSNL